MNLNVLPVVICLLGRIAPGAPMSPEVARLAPAQLDLFNRVAADEFCGCASALTLAGCLDKKPTCKIATDLARLLAHAVEMNAPQNALEQFLSQEVLGPFCAPAIPLQVSGAPHKGKAGAAVTVVEFADFRCSHCRHAVPMVHKAMEAYGSKAELFYMPISLQENEQSTAAAEAALAANAQGKFWEMHAALFAREAGDFDPPVLRDIAKKVGLNLKQFDKDVASHRFRDTLASWKKLSQTAGVTGTPAFFVNGRRFNLTPEVFELEARLEMEADRDAGDCK